MLRQRLRRPRPLRPAGWRPCSPLPDAQQQLTFRASHGGRGGRQGGAGALAGRCRRWIIGRGGRPIAGAHAHDSLRCWRARESCAGAAVRAGRDAGGEEGAQRGVGPAQFNCPAAAGASSPAAASARPWRIPCPAFPTPAEFILRPLPPVCLFDNSPRKPLHQKQASQGRVARGGLAKMTIVRGGTRYGPGGGRLW